MTKPKYEFLDPFPSLIGTTFRSMQAGDVGPIITQLTLFNTKNATDDDIIKAKNQISSILADEIFPRLLKLFSATAIPKDFSLYAVYIEMHGNERKNKILINEDTRFYITCQTKKGIPMKKNDPVKIDDIEQFISIEKKDKDPNAATIMLALNKNGWFGQFDFIYNRENTKEKANRAIDFFNSAVKNLESSNMTGFYQSLSDCSELLAESLLLLHNHIKLKASHKNIRISFEHFCELNNLKFIEDYKKISTIRNHARYGPPHPSTKNQNKDAPVLLQTIRELLGFVLMFLRERQVAPVNPDVLTLPLDLAAVR